MVYHVLLEAIHKHIFTQAFSRDSSEDQSKVRKVLRRAEKCNGAYTTATSNGARLAVYPCAHECHCRCLATYAGEPLLFPRESAYVAATKNRSGRDCGAWWEFFWVFRASLFLSLALRTRDPVFPSSKPKLRYSLALCFPRKRSLRRFVSEGEAVVTNFTPPPSTLILVRENTIRGSCRFNGEFSANNPPRKSARCFPYFLMKFFFFPNINICCKIYLFFIVWRLEICLQISVWVYMYNSKNICN